MPSNFKTEETTAQLEKLVKYCNGISEAVASGSDDATLKTMITEAHEVFHKIVGECKRQNNLIAHHFIKKLSEMTAFLLPKTKADITSYLRK